MDLLEPDALDEETHQHLSKDCPWYAKVASGEGAANPGDHCGPAPGTTKALVKFTSHTAEASTADKPTVPPGGPGLFHVKGLHLPPYIQHLWFHLAAKYGKHRAYGMAVGIVKKWAAGVNPGGWDTKSGKGKRTHPDVRAAAAKNVAEWEADKAKAHKQSASHVKASASLVSPGPPYPGQKLLPLPPVPRAARAMYTAHRLNNVLNFLAHAEERLGAAGKSRALRAYHMIHVSNHLSRALDDTHSLVENVNRNYPAEARELKALTKTLGLARSEGQAAKEATFAHLLQTILYHLAHAKRHAEVMRNPDPAALWKFNFDHCATHAKGALEHGFKLARHIQDNYPAEAALLDELADVEDPDTDYTGLAAAPAGGTYAQYGLWQHPAQTLSPSPPLPPGATLPTAAEVRAVAKQVPDCVNISLSNQARIFLEQAAGKLEKDDRQMALEVLRSAQTALSAAHRADLAVTMPSQYTARILAQVPPAQAGAANNIVLQGRDRALLWRRLEHETAALIDRMRRIYFHNRVNGQTQNMRMSGEPSGTVSASLR